MTTTPLPEAPVRSTIELTARWSALLEPPVFGARSLWCAWLGAEGRMLPLLMPIDELPGTPGPDTGAGVLRLHEAVVEMTGLERPHLALALCRPGEPAVTADDVAWAEALRTAVGERIDGSWSLHLAAAGTVVPMVPPPPWALA